MNTRSRVLASIAVAWLAGIVAILAWYRTHQIARYIPPPESPPTDARGPGAYQLGTTVHDLDTDALVAALSVWTAVAVASVALVLIWTTHALRVDLAHKD